jgi:hypothetical protein
MKIALRKLGGDPLGGSQQEFAAFLAKEAPRWVAVVNAAGLKLD